MATIYLSPTGDDTTGDGTSGTPYKTLFKCISVASNGDTIYHKAGTYTNLGTKTTITKSLTITGASGVVIDVSAYPADYNGATFVHSVDVTWSGLTIDKYTYGSDTSYATDALFERSVDDVNLTLNNMIISNSKHKARAGYDRGGLISTGLGASPKYGGSITLNRCLFYNIEQYGVANPTASGYMINSVGSAAKPTTFNVINCTFHFRAPTTGNSASNGIWHYCVYNTVNWKNNIIYNETGGTFNWANYVSSTTTNYNYNDSYLLTGTPSGTGNITSDPLFIDLTNRNFHLRPSSPCVGTGQVI